MNTFSLIFLAFLTLSVAAELWLARRQIAYVRAHRAEVPQAFRDRIDLDAHQKAADYTIVRNRIGMVSSIYSAVILLLWTLGGGLQWLDILWTTSGFSNLIQGTATLLSLFIIGALLDLPFSWYNTFHIEQRFGFNKTTIGTFVTDLAKNAVLLLVIGTPLLYAVLWFMNNTGSRWWLYTWFLWSGFNLLAVWAYPALIAPLFNRFTPLQEGGIRDRIQALLKRTGFRSRGIFVMDGSRRSAHGNAYFTGLGRSKRVVFFDTLLKSLSAPEVEAVLAHELGHFKLHHITKRIALSFGLSFAGLALLGWLGQQAWFYTGLGMHTVPDHINHIGLALFILSMPVFMFFFSPLMAWGSRKHEFEADDFASRHANAGDLVNALVKLYSENAKTLTPDPLHSIFYDSHPPAPVRIAHLQQRH
ncbi:MAG: M48 family metallopeptidase [Acidiferrobacteraceae bacterium]|jgi:STE24 endopeptidase